MANVMTFQSARSASTPADLFLRVGETHYSQLAILRAEGKLPIARAIFDASKLKHQVDFIKTLRDEKVELTLDTKMAELAALTRYQGNPSGAPWADGTLHLPELFDDRRCQVVAEHIAQVAVDQGFDRVLSPSHLLREGLLDPWFGVDKRLCAALRKALDQAGGGHIAIDYNLMIDRFARQIKELKPVATDLKPRRGQSAEQAAESLSARLSKQSLRNEKMRASLEDLHSVRGLAAPRIRRAHLADRVRAGRS